MTDADFSAEWFIWINGLVDAGWDGIEDASRDMHRSFVFHDFWAQIALVVLLQQILSMPYDGIATRLWQLTGQWYPADGEAFE